MNPEDELRRLRRFLVVSWSLLLVSLLVLTYWGSLQIRNLKSTIAYSSSKQSVVIRGVDGKNGANGQNGLSIIGPSGSAGSNGRDGLSVTSDQVAAAVIAYIQANPPVGPQGSPGSNGADGLTQELRVNYDTCQLESKYSISDNWSPIAQLPSPCVLNTEAQ